MPSEIGLYVHTADDSIGLSPRGYAYMYIHQTYRLCIYIPQMPFMYFGLQSTIFYLYIYVYIPVPIASRNTSYLRALFSICTNMSISVFTYSSLEDAIFYMYFGLPSTVFYMYIYMYRLVPIVSCNNLYSTHYVVYVLWTPKHCILCVHLYLHTGPNRVVQCLVLKALFSRVLSRFQ